MGVFITLCLSIFTMMGSYEPVKIIDAESCPLYTQGYVKDNQVYICPDLSISRDIVISHEVAHLIQNSLGGDILLPPSILDYLIRETLTEAEVLSVIVHYGDSGYMPQELEARVLSKVDKDVIMYMYWLTEEYVSLTTRI